MVMMSLHRNTNPKTAGNQIQAYKDSRHQPGKLKAVYCSGDPVDWRWRTLYLAEAGARKGESKKREELASHFSYTVLDAQGA